MLLDHSHLTYWQAILRNSLTIGLGLSTRAPFYFRVGDLRPEFRELNAKHNDAGHQPNQHPAFLSPAGLPF